MEAVSTLWCTHEVLMKDCLAGQLTEKFEVKTGVRQGCLLLPSLFLLAINWIMRSVRIQKRKGDPEALVAAVGRPGRC